MLPEILDSIEDVIDTMMPLLVMIVVTIGAYLTVRVWRGKGPSQRTLESIDEKLSAVLENSDAVRQELGEIQDRVEFTERLLTKSAERAGDSP